MRTSLPPVFISQSLHLWEQLRARNSPHTRGGAGPHLWDTVVLRGGPADRVPPHLRPPGRLGAWMQEQGRPRSPAVGGHRGPAPGTRTQCCSVRPYTLASGWPLLRFPPRAVVQPPYGGAASLWGCSFCLGVQPWGEASQLSHPGTPCSCPWGSTSQQPLQRGLLRFRPYPWGARTWGPRCGLERLQNEP